MCRSARTVRTTTTGCCAEHRKGLGVMDRALTTSNSEVPALLRSAIRDEVASIWHFDELEEIHRADALAWIDSGAPLCRTAKPATPAKHLVSYFAVVDGGNILLVDHRNAQLWLPPGGHVEPRGAPAGNGEAGARGRAWNCCWA